MTFEFDLASLEAHDKDIRLAERERIADKLRDQAADLIADGHMASAELVLLGKLIDWLEGEQK